ncbi:MAG: LpxL/LpxP family Kdo(2)-lipid IV(A) lauroyl/palmitoleoyl acyltransferase [Gammaproteobacteria bacterium]
MPYTILCMPQLALFAPRYWLTWLMVMPFAVLVFLPWRMQFACGRLIGRGARRLARRRRAITAANLERCFPDLGPADRERLLREHFEALGIGLFETALCWWAPDWRLQRRVHIEGMEHLQRAAEAGHGVLMLTAHFTTLELGGRLLSLKHPVMVVYRPHENPVINYLMRTRRDAHGSAGVIRRGDLRTMLRSLRKNATIWYAPDQAYLGPRGVEAPFFGIPAPTNTATSRIAAASNAPVLPFFVKRLANGHYRLAILPTLEGFPSGDDLADAARVNAVLEQGIREAPAQYLWSHDRFKQFRRP